MSDSQIPVTDPRDVDADKVRALLLTSMQNALNENDRQWLASALKRMHPADASDALEQLSPDEFSSLVALLGDELPSDVLIELRDEYREDAVELLSDEAVSAALGDLDSDDAAAILEDVDADRRDRILDDLSPEDRVPLVQALDFDEETAGRLMQREFVAAPEFGPSATQSIMRGRRAKHYRSNFSQSMLWIHPLGRSARFLCQASCERQET